MRPFTEYKQAISIIPIPLYHPSHRIHPHDVQPAGQVPHSQVGVRHSGRRAKGAAFDTRGPFNRGPELQLTAAPAAAAALRRTQSQFVYVHDACRQVEAAVREYSS